MRRDKIRWNSTVFSHRWKIYGELTITKDSVLLLLLIHSLLENKYCLLLMLLDLKARVLFIDSIWNENSVSKQIYIQGVKLEKWTYNFQANTQMILCNIISICFYIYNFSMTCDYEIAPPRFNITTALNEVLHKSDSVLQGVCYRTKFKEGQTDLYSEPYSSTITTCFTS